MYGDGKGQVSFVFIHITVNTHHLSGPVPNKRTISDSVQMFCKILCLKRRVPAHSTHARSFMNDIDFQDRQSFVL